MNNQEKVWKLLEDLKIVVIYNNELTKEAISTNYQYPDGSIKPMILINPLLVPQESLPYYLAHEVRHLILHHAHNSIKNEAEANRWAIEF